MAKDLVNLLIVALVLIVGLTTILYFLPCGTTIEKFAPLSPAAAAAEAARKKKALAAMALKKNINQLVILQKAAKPTVAQVINAKEAANAIAQRSTTNPVVRTAAMKAVTVAYTPGATGSLGAAATKAAVANLIATMKKARKAAVAKRRAEQAKMINNINNFLKSLHKNNIWYKTDEL